MSETQLVLYDAMCRAIQAAYLVDEVVQIRTRAMQIEAAARIARDRQWEEKARAVRQRAERRAGELLAASPKNTGGRPSENRSDHPTSFPTTIAERGITKQQSSDWQTMAKVPEETFEREVAEGASTEAIVAGQRIREQPVADTIAPEAMSFWGLLRDFERERFLEMDPADLLETMLDHQKATVLALTPRIAAWLRRFPV